MIMLLLLRGLDKGGDTVIIVDGPEKAGDHSRTHNVPFMFVQESFRTDQTDILLIAHAFVFLGYQANAQPMSQLAHLFD